MAEIICEALILSGEIGVAISSASLYFLCPGESGWTRAVAFGCTPVAIALAFLIRAAFLALDSGIVYI